MVALLVSRAQAIADGKKRYFTGSPCVRGHVAERYVNGGCAECCTLRKIENAASEKVRLQKWRADNPDRVKAYDARKARIRAANRQPKAIIGRKESSRQWRAKNIEYDRARCRAWHKANPEKSLAIMRNRRALKRAAEGKHTAAEIEALYQRQRAKCANCLTSLKPCYHVDHIIPLARGGSNWISNIQLLCPTCNISKSALDPIVWAQREGRLI